jgi:hypothetical protein
MALPALDLETVRKMDKAGRTGYFENYARYSEDSPCCLHYAIRVGSKTLFSEDTADLRQKFDKLLRYGE